MVGLGVGRDLVYDHLLVGGVQSSDVARPGYGQEDVIVELSGDKGWVSPHQLGGGGGGGGGRGDINGDTHVSNDGNLHVMCQEVKLQWLIVQ